MQYKWKRDCKHFVGFIPCKPIKQHQHLNCDNCKYYEPINKRILIIKIGRLGDVIRTTCILHAFKKKYPNSEINWLVNKEYSLVLKNNRFIDNVYSNEDILVLNQREFDLMINLDIDPPGTAIANLINAKEKLGYYLGKDGKTSTYNKGADYLLEIALSDQLKRNNKKTYQEQIFDIIGIPYNNEEYVLDIPEQDKEFAFEILREHYIRDNDLVVGINTGGSKTWPLKKWNNEKFAELIDRLNNKLNAKIILFGGIEEEEINQDIKNKIKTSVIKCDVNNTIMQFAALINRCNLLVTGDTAAMHIALALKTPLVALFGPSSHNEIHMYNLGKKIVSSIDCVCCYNRECNKKPHCMDKITTDEVFNTISEFLKK